MASNIHPSAIIDPKANMGADVTIGPYCVIGPKVQLGDRCRLHSHVVIDGRTTMGTNNEIYAQAVLGAAPQDLKYKGEETELVIGDDNVFREHTSVHLGTVQDLGLTRIGDRNLVMANAHIAHDCVIGNDVIIANSVLLAGHVHIEDHVVLSGACALHHYVTVGEHAFIGGLTRIVHDCPPFMIMEGHPSKLRGINRIGLERKGFDEAQISRLRDAYKRIYKADKSEPDEGVNVEDGMAQLVSEYPDDTALAKLQTFMKQRGQSAFGRYREHKRD